MTVSSLKFPSLAVLRTHLDATILHSGEFPNSDFSALAGEEAGFANPVCLYCVQDLLYQKGFSALVSCAGKAKDEKGGLGGRQ
jgi:hypothetical protein